MEGHSHYTDRREREGGGAFSLCRQERGRDVGRVFSLQIEEREREGHSYYTDRRERCRRAFILYIQKGERWEGHSYCTDRRERGGRGILTVHTEGREVGGAFLLYRQKEEKERGERGILTVQTEGREVEGAFLLYRQKGERWEGHSYHTDRRERG